MGIKRLGILNFQHSNHNYGAVLQAAALHEFVTKNTEYEAEHIDYIPFNSSKSVFSKIKKIVKKYLIKLGYENGKIHHSYFLNPGVFEDFRREWVPRTSKQYNTFSSLAQADFSYSHLIVGSDQVWRPSYTNNSSSVYFLEFAKPAVKRISYAASFGNDKWNENNETTVSANQALSKFHKISVREKTGVKIASNIFSVNATHVLDPTLLIGRLFFDNVIQEKHHSTNSLSVVYYKLDIDSEFTNAIVDISNELDCSSINIYYKSTRKGYEYYPVGEWLGFIRNSRLVVTDSFHCVCFAILFNKPFICYPNNNRGNTRLESLLDSLGLMHLILKDSSKLSKLILEANSINYTAVNNKLMELRAYSSAFLMSSLEE